VPEKQLRHLTNLKNASAKPGNQVAISCHLKSVSAFQVFQMVRLETVVPENQLRASPQLKNVSARTVRHASHRYDLRARGAGNVYSL
jgi:hypothetical protein